MIVKDFINNNCIKKKYSVAIGIDVRNSFNSLPWNVIIRQLIKKRFPEYLVNIIRNYLSDRVIVFPVAGGSVRARQMCAGVPQGSILGPMLWNLTYDWVLRSTLQPQTELICYADDTLVISTASTPTLAAWRATATAAVVINRIQRLGLEISVAKNESDLFHAGSKRVDPAVINILDKDIVTSDSLKYLGVIFDRRLNFKKHFEYIECKANRVLRYLWKLMPNLRGPLEEKRRFYSNVIHSILLYGAPVWAEAFGQYKSYQLSIRRIQRSLALRIISAYRTVSYESSLILARIPPFNLLANKSLRIYTRKRELYQAGNFTVDDLKDIYDSAELLLRRQWFVTLNNDLLPGKLTRFIILPKFNEWLDKKHGNLNYFLTQAMTGHGSFATYLFRIRKADSSNCYYCDSRCDSAEHTLFVCPAWERGRRTLSMELGIDSPLNWKILMPRMLNSKEEWRLIATFVKKIMEQKEKQEKAMKRQLRANIPRRGVYDSDES